MNYVVEAVRSSNDSESGLHQAVRLCIRISLLLAIYLVFEWWIFSVSQLSPTSYEHPVILIELAKNVGLVQLAVLMTFVILLVRYRFIWQTWSEFEHGIWLRRLVMLSAFILVWWYATYDYNLYFNQAHYVDRSLLLILFGLIYWRPIFVLPFLLLLVSVVGQFYHPLVGYSVAEQFVFVRILMLFFAMFVLRGLLGHKNSTDFVFLVCCLIASSYWWPGFGKIRIDWISHGHIYFLLSATYANGWLGFLEPGTIAALTKAVSNIDWLMRGMTILVEFGALFFLWRRHSMLIFLSGWIVFHLGVFALSGIFFWKWIVLDFCMLAFFWGKNQAQFMPLFTRERFALSIVLIASCSIWFKPVNLSWYDSRVSYTYRFEAVGESGEKYNLPPHFFKPYQYQFTLGSFGYLTQQPHLSIVWGATFDRTVADLLVQSKSPNQILAIESELGQIHFNPARAASFDKFIKNFVANLNLRRSKDTWLSVIQPPPQLWTFATGKTFCDQEQIAQVDIYQVTSLYDEERYLEIRNELVRQIKIATPPRLSKVRLSGAVDSGDSVGLRQRVCMGI